MTQKCTACKCTHVCSLKFDVGQTKSFLCQKRESDVCDYYLSYLSGTVEFGSRNLFMLLFSADLYGSNQKFRPHVRWFALDLPECPGGIGNPDLTPSWDREIYCEVYGDIEYCADSCSHVRIGYAMRDLFGCLCANWAHSNKYIVADLCWFKMRC